MKAVISALLGCLFLCFNTTTKAQELEPKQLSISHDSSSYPAYLESFKEADRWVYDNPSKSIESIQRALDFAQQLKDSCLIASAFNRMAIVMKQTGDHLNAQQLYFDALRIYEAIGYIDGEICVLNNIGRLYHDQVNEEQAMNYYGIALKRAKQLPSNPHHQAALFHNIGEVHSAAGAYKKAYLFLKKALVIKQQQGDIEGSIDIIANIAHVYSETGRPEDAERSYLQATQLQENKSKLRYGAADTYIQFAKFYTKTRQYAKAKTLIMQGLSMAKQMHEKEALLDAYLALAELEEVRGNSQQALQAYKSYNSLEDSMFSMQRNLIIADTRVKYEVEKKSQENQLLKQEKIIRDDELRLKKLQSTLVSIALFAFFVISAILFFGYKQKTKDNARLSRKNIQLDQQRIKIEQQKTAIESKNASLSSVNVVLAQQNERITDSLVYGQSVQSAVLPTLKQLKEQFQEGFIIFRPKDIVSGDFYWLTQTRGKTFFALADCTGHGVPGAFMSLLGHAFLHEIILIRHILEPHLILEALHDTIIESLHQKDGINQDGMTISLFSLEQQEGGNTMLQFSGAKMDLHICRNQERWETLEGDRANIGGIRRGQNFKEFTLHTAEVQPHDQVYLFTDGFPDQANPKYRRFGSSRLIQLLKHNCGKSFAEQRKALIDALLDHQQQMDQRDDISLIGLKI